MAMMSGDRSSGGYYSYTTTRVPYELSELTKKVFEQLGAGTSEEKLWKLLGTGSDADLLRFHKDMEVAKDQDFSRGKEEVLSTFKALEDMATAVIESRKPGPRLCVQILDRLEKGTSLAELQALIESAAEDAVRELPQHLGRMLANVQAKQPEQAPQIKELVEVLKLIAAKRSSDGSSGARPSVAVEPARTAHCQSHEDPPTSPQLRQGILRRWFPWLRKAKVRGRE